MTQVIDNKHRNAPDAINLAEANLSNKFAFSNRVLGKPVDRFFNTANKKARGLVGGLEALYDAVLTNAGRNDVDPQKIIDAMIQQNEEGFNSSFGVSEENKSDGRLAIVELVDYMNGRSTRSEAINQYTVTANEPVTEMYNKVATDPLLDKKLEGVLWLLSQSFIMETNVLLFGMTSEDVSKQRAELLASILSNATVSYVPLFEEFEVEGDDLFFVGDSSLRYSEYIALALTMVTLRDFGKAVTENNPNEPEIFAVPIPSLNLAYGLQSIVKRFFELDENIAQSARNNVDDIDNDVVHFDGDKIRQAFDRLDVPKDELTTKDTELFNMLSSYVFSYDLGTKQNLFANEFIKNPMGEILYRLSQVFFSMESLDNDLPIVAKKESE